MPIIDYSRGVIDHRKCSIDYRGKNIISCWQIKVLKLFFPLLWSPDKRRKRISVIIRKHGKNSELSGPQSKNSKSLYYMYFELHKGKNKLNYFKHNRWLIGWVNLIISDDRLWNLSRLPTLLVNVCCLSFFEWGGI